MPIIVLSGYDEFDYARQAMRFGVMDYLLKPLEAAALEEALQRVRAVIVPKSEQVERNLISAGLFGHHGGQSLISCPPTPAIASF